MTQQRKQYARLVAGVLIVSLAGWVMLLTRSGSASALSSAMCGGSGSLSPESPALGLGHQVSNWVLMLMAMMMPTLAPPVYFIWQTSFARLRAMLITLFFSGFGLVWLLVGAALTGAQLAASALAPQSWWPAGVVGLVALIWQASPFKQICLNRCRRHLPLAAFGFAAAWDGFKTGWVHGMWCAGSCWASMLFPMVLPSGHHAAMAAVTVLMFCERMDPAARPAWRWRGFGTSFLWMEKTFRCWHARILPSRQPATTEASWQASNTA
jgi:predicted metal-binding membrane protein